MNETIRYDVKYINQFKQKDKIKLEFKVNHKKMPKVNLKIINPGQLDNIASLYQVYSLEELYNQKINAFLNRDEGKDIYDIYYILQIKKYKINRNVILKLESIIKDPLKIKYYNNSTNHFIFKKNRIDFKELCMQLLKTN
jgi:hypothetical protein